MKCAAALALLLCAALGFGAMADSARVQKFSFLGKEYIRIDQWARANSFQWKWVAKNDLEVWSQSTRMQFTTDSKRMSLNGITVLLSEPVLNQSGAAHVAALDFSTAIQPVLFPPKNRPRTTVKNICIDPGHGGKDIGEHVGSENEKKYTLLLAQELGAQLRKAGFNVTFTRTTDSFIDLPERPDIARRRGADLFICLHFNSSGAGGLGVQGAETYCLTPARASSTNARGEGGNSGNYSGNLNNAKNMLLAYEIQKNLVRGAKSEDRGVKRARFAVLRDATMPAVLIEGGFMSNPAEARNIYSATWRRQLAASIASGIGGYKKIVEP